MEEKDGVRVGGGVAGLWWNSRLLTTIFLSFPFSLIFLSRVRRECVCARVVRLIACKKQTGDSW